jgi:hypothetical protein
MRLFLLLRYISVFVFGRVQRLQVYFVSGLVKNTGEPMTAVLAGKEWDVQQFCSIAYSQIQRTLPIGEIMPFQIQAFTESMTRIADLIVICSRMPLAQGFQKHGYFVLPTLSFKLDLHGSIEDLQKNMSRRRRRDIRKIKSFDYSYFISRNDDESFDFFYWNMYLPFAGLRFGKAASIRKYAEAKALYQNNGGIIFVEKDKNPVAGILFQKRGKTVYAISYGIHECGKERHDLSGQAALLCLIEWAKGNFIEYLDYGLCLPFLKDGIFTYKKEWGMSVCKRPELLVLAVKLCSANSACASFLQSNPFIALDGNALKGLVFLDHKPATSELQQIFAEYILPGVKSIIVVACCNSNSGIGAETEANVKCSNGGFSHCLSEFRKLISLQGLNAEFYEVKTNLSA